MADWADLLLPASFRGIPFFVDTHEKTGGRNAIGHEIPERDNSFSEDMGKRSDGFRITGHVLGDTYFFIRDALITAMEKKEPGILIHPYLGLIDVQPAEYTFSEDTKEGRVARFEINFIEAGEPNVVFGALDAVSGFITSAVSAVARIENAFAVAVTFSGLPSFAVESATGLITGLMTTISESMDKISADSEERSKLNTEIQQLNDNAKQSLGDPRQLAKAIDSIMEGLKSLPADLANSDTIDTSSGKSDDLAIFDNILAGIGGDETGAVTATRIQEQTNNNALNNMFKQYIIVRLSEVSVDKDFNTTADALDQREVITALIEEQILKESIDDDLFQALKDHKSSVAGMIPDPRKAVSSVKEITLLKTIPSLVLSYNLYGSAENENDIIDRNQVANPSFVSGDLEVING